MRGGILGYAVLVGPSQNPSYIFEHAFGASLSNQRGKRKPLVILLQGSISVWSVYLTLDNRSKRMQPRHGGIAET